MAGFESREHIVGASRWSREIRRELRVVAPLASTVLITGPSGTGKELIAREFHRLSPRSEGPFVPVDCGAVTGDLFAAHLFGHVRGAFTGANHDALGCFRAAAGGTIFLDEIGELERKLQVNLLRVLQQRAVVPVGGHCEIPVDVRVVAATNRDLRSDVEAGAFREDLYYRLNVVAIETTPLRNRLADIPPLAEHFLRLLSIHHGVPEKTLSPETVLRLQDYDWPGNVRELKNAMERAAIYCSSQIIGPGDLAIDFESRPEFRNDVQNRLAEPAVELDDAWPTLDDLQREHVRATLERTYYNQTAAAELLGISRHKLRRMIQRLDLDISPLLPGRPRISREQPTPPDAG